MAKKQQPNAFDFNFKDSLTSEDYQKIIIHQNHAIIQLLQNSMTDNLIVTAFNGTVINKYKESLKGFVDIYKNYGSKKDPSTLSERKQMLLRNLKARQEKGEDISRKAWELGLDEYID